MSTGNGEVTAFDPEKPFRTRDGRNVPDLKKATGGGFFGTYEGSSHTSTWFDDGRFLPQKKEHSLDLVNVVPPTTSRDDLGDGESEAAILEDAIGKLRYLTRGLSSVTSDNVASKTIPALERMLARAVATNAEPVGWSCKARNNVGANDPQDCNWPQCGCDPYAEKVLVAIQDQGFEIASSSDPESEGDGWRSIASAPRDGTWFLAAWTGTDGQNLVQWHNAWCVEHHACSLPPTHWRPLPPAPTLKQEGVADSEAAWTAWNEKNVYLDGARPDSKMIAFKAGFAAAHVPGSKDGQS